MLALATFMGFALQCMAVRLGVVTGKNLARVCKVRMELWQGKDTFGFEGSSRRVQDMCVFPRISIALSCAYQKMEVHNVIILKKETSLRP